MPLKSMILESADVTSLGVKKEVPFVLASFGPVNPLPMQYLGAKGRISKWIISSIEEELPKLKVFVDLFAGTGAVSLEAVAEGYKVILNDIQPYSYALLNSIFERPKIGLKKPIEELQKITSKKRFLLKGSRNKLADALSQEEFFIDSLKQKKFNWKKYKDFCEATPRFSNNIEIGSKKADKSYNLFSWYYPNTYFGIRQSLEIDAIREFADQCSPDVRAHILAAVISSMTFNVSSTTHLAQYIKPNNSKQAEFVLRKRSKSILESVLHRLTKLAEPSIHFKNSEVLNLDYLEALRHIAPTKNTIVYADPPYFKEHYSRYYHVLDTFYLYDYPELSLNKQTNKITEGKYRTNRIISDFGLKSKVKDAFLNMLEACRDKHFSVAISYANTSLINQTEMKKIIKKSGFRILSIKEKGLMHSAQGQPNNKIAQEYLYILSPQND